MSITLSPAHEKRLLLTLAGIQFTHILDFMLIMPLGPMLMRAFHLSTAQFGVLISSYTFTGAVAAILAAVVIDRFNRRRVVLCCYAGFILATAASALAPSYAVLLLTRAAAGLFGGVLGALIHTYIGDTIPFERRGHATGKVMAAFSLSTVIGVPLGLMAANMLPMLGWRAPFLLAALIALGFWGLAFRVLPSIPSRMTDTRLSQALMPLRHVLTQANHWRAFGFMSLLMLGGFSVIPYITLYATLNLGYPESYLPLMYLIGGACTFFTARWFGKLADKHGKARTFRVIAVLSLLPIVAMTHAVALPWWGVLCITTPFFILVSGRFVPGMAMMTSAATPALRGTFMSLNSAVQGAGSGFATLVAGYLIRRNETGEILHYSWVGYVACAATLGAVWLAGRVKAAS
jgi:predicted MFS family arabinose efflux permease